MFQDCIYLLNTIGHAVVEQRELEHGQGYAINYIINNVPRGNYVQKQVFLFML
jgi:hypothetical protein